MKTLKTLLITLIAIIAASPVLAQKPPQEPQKPKHHKQWFKQHRDKTGNLDLTEDQQKQIKQIRLDLRKAIIPLRNQLREKRARLQTLTTGPNTDFSAADKVVDELSGLRAEMIKKGLHSRKQIRDLLTDEQRVKFDARRAFGKGQFAREMQWHHRK